MTVHSHTYQNLSADGYALTFGDVDSLRGISSVTCPSGHSHCKGSGGTLQTWKKPILIPGTLITNAVEDIPGHVHTYKHIKVTDSLPYLSVAVRGSQSWAYCDLDPIYCAPITGPALAATAAEIEDKLTEPGGSGSHYHDILIANSLEYAPLTGFTTCSLGHAGCSCVTTDPVLFIYPDVWGAVSFWELPTYEFTAETLAPGWTATLLTLTPPPYITQVWALVRGDLQALEADYKGIYLGFDFGKTTDYGIQQWYNPPGGATKIYNPLLFSANLGGLAPGNTYHYRAKVTLNDINAALLRGSVTLSGEAEGLTTSLYFEWGETETYGQEVLVKTTNYSTTFSQVLVELDPEITYHYRAKAVNDLGTVYGADVEFLPLGIYYGEDQSFETLSALPPVSPIFGVGNDYNSAKQGIENVADLSLARGYVDTEGNFQYESRFRRQV